jgi:HlyD family secretion protein
MKTRTKVVAGVGGLALAALIVWALQPQPIAVEVATVTKGEFEQWVNEDGKTRVRDRYVVSAPLAGRVQRITLKAGDNVDEGQVVAVLTPTIPPFLDARAESEIIERVGAAEAQRLRANSELQKTQAQLAQVAADRDRTAKLAQQGFVSAAAREQAELAVRTAERAVDAATFAEHAALHDESQARAALARYRAESAGKVSRSARWDVRSPVNGSVLKIIQESEGVVALGAPLVEVADARSLEAAVDVLSQDAINLIPGLEARIELGPEAPRLAARIRKVEPAAFTKVSALGIEEQRVNVILEFAEPLERVRTIGDGFRVDAQIVTFRSPAAVKAPVAALFRDGAQWYVFIVAANRAHQQPVTVSRRNATEAVIDHGLDPGAEVVTYPNEALRDGAPVVVARRRGNGGGS